MASDTQDRDTQNKAGAEGKTTESRTTLNSDNALHSGLLDDRDQTLDKAHDYHLDQDMGDSMEQVNANLHLGDEEQEQRYVEQQNPSFGAQSLVFENLTVEPSSHDDGETTGPSIDLSANIDDFPEDRPDFDHDSAPTGSSSSASIASVLNAGPDLTYAGSTSSGQFDGSFGTQEDTNSFAAPFGGESDDTAAGARASDLGAVADIDESENAVDENSAAGSATGIQAEAGTADGTSVVYSLLDDAGGLFAIDPETGIVTVAGALDAETAGSHQIVVLATGSDGSTQTETFKIQIRDVNEHDVSAIETVGAVADTISEVVAGGSEAGITVVATDQDVSDSVSYSVDDPRFVIDDQGVVSIADDAVFDAETEATVSFTVTATSTDGSQSEQTFTLAVEDENEFATSAIQDIDTAANCVAEDAVPGTQVGITAFAQDQDATDTVSYAVDDARFTVDENGVVRVAEGASFDAETEGSISLTVTATSSDGSSSQETFTIAVSDVNESAVSSVTDTDIGTDTIAENVSAGTQVGITVHATDSDITDTVSYSVDDDRFSVDENGVVRVAEGASFDAETEGSISLTVTATSTDGSTSQETFTVEVSDINEYGVSALTDTDSAENSIAENATEGTQVGVTAFAEDKDATDAVSYAVDDARFTVDENGVVRVAEGASFDAETEGSISLTVTATSTDGSTSQETFTIAVSDVNESAVSSVADTDTGANTIAENVSAGTQVGITVLATDSDITDTVSYSVDDDRFTVDENGVVRVADGASFDFESEPNISLTVTATSSDGSTSSDAFAVSVTDVAEDYQLEDGGQSFTDNSVAETSITGGSGDDTIVAHADGGNVYGADGDDTISGNGAADTLAGGAGDDTLTGGAGDDTIDGGLGTDTATYSGNFADYTITENEGIFTVTDNRAGSSDGTDTVVNVENFRFADGDILAGDLIAKDISAVSDTDSGANTVAEDAAAGTAVGVTAFAEDENTSDTVSYTVDDDRFTVDENGVVRVADGASFDAETEGSIDITVTAISSDGSTSAETFTVSVSDVDEYDVSSVSDTDAAANEVAEDAVAGTQVGITAFAKDGDVTDTVSYSVDDDRFTVDDNGVVRVADGASFDAETEGSIDILVTATSSDGSTSQESFTISASDVNETSVSAVTDVDAAANGFAEDATEGTVVGITAQAMDADATDTVTYSVSDDRFTVGDDGVITVAAGATFDYESEPTIKVAVTATSSDGSTSQETFELAVSDVAETYQLAEGQTTFTDTGVAETSITGNDSADTITAHDDGSTIYSGAGDDTIYGGAGDDTILFGEGADVVYGGAGDDFIDDERGSQPNTGDNYLDGGDGNDTMYGGGGNDTMIGGAGNDTLRGEGDDDTLDGGDGDDILVGGVGDDSIDGGSGNDAVYYSGNRSDYDISENSDGSYTVIDTRTDSPDGTDTVANVEKFCFSDGDVLAGDLVAKDVSTVSDSDTAANTVAEDAAAGTEVGVTASANDENTSDTVSYSVDDDRFTVDDNGVVRVADGASFDAETEGSIDILVTATSSDGSTSQESFTISASDVNETSVSAVTDVDAAANGFAEDATEGTVVGITAQAMDADATDTVTYSVSDDRFTVGDDGVITVAAGATFDYESEPTIKVAVTATSSDGSTSQETFELAVSDVAETYQLAEGQTTFTDTGVAETSITGNDSADTITAHDDGSTIYSGAGDDTIYGGAGDDTILFGEGADVVYGGAGDDFIDDERGSQPNTGDNYLDGGDGNDTMYGGGGNDTMIGGAGNDTLRGEGDDDTLDGGDGDDILVGGVGDDSIDGGSGNDAVYYSGNRSDYDITENSDGSYTVIDTRTDSPDGTDTVANVEKFCFSDGDVLAGDLVAKDVSTVSDSDTAANTIIENGEEGSTVGIKAFADDANTSDSVSYSVNDARFSVDDDGTVRLAAGASFDYESEPEINITVTATSTDGSSSSESFSLSVSDVSENLQLADGGVTFTDTGVAESTITGGTGDDSITAHNDGGTTIDGGDGSDKLQGGAGNDMLIGGAGADLLQGGAGDDTFQVGGDGTWSSGYSAQNTVTDETVSITGRIRSSDVFEGGEGTDTLLGTDGSDAIFLHDTYSDKHADASEPRLVSIENVNLGAGDDILDMTSDTHAYTTDMTVDGGVGDDIIWTGAGNDTILGGEGNDSLFGGAGNDTLDGGAGTDTAIYSGNWEDYDIVHNDDGSYTISDLRADAPDGIDTVSNVESYRFADVELQSDELIDRPVGDVSDTDSAENTIHELDGAGTHVGITAFAEDPNGEAITYTLSDDRFEFGADGVVTVADHAFFDSQVENSIDLTVTATSEDGSQSNQSFAVSVTGAYDGTFTGDDEAGSFTGTDKSYSVDGGGGDDSITTGDFNDRLDGGANGGNDTLDGGGGNDLMFGRGGDDVIYGRAGDDTIIGGAGNDTLYGGDGSDLFMHGLGDGNDTIDAGAGAGWTDVIDLGGGPDIASAGVYETDWTVTITSGSIESTDTDGGRIDLSQDADGYIDFADGSRVNFNDVEEIRW